MKLAFKVLVLVLLLVIGLTQPFAVRTSVATAALTCDPQKCQIECERKGFPFGTCGSLTHQCVCHAPFPPPDQQP
jgi:hypothetical protein